MELLINELSLNGQYKTIEEFIISLNEFIRILKVAEAESILVLKNYDFYNRKITNDITLAEILKIRGKDEIRRIKLFLSRMFDPPYWEEDQKHTKDTQYKYMEYEDLYGTSLAEAHARNQVVASFRHIDFLESELEIQVNREPVIIYNILGKSAFADHLYKKTNIIDELTFCHYKYDNTRLSFEQFEKKFGFMQLQRKEIEMVIETFDRIIERNNWNEIYNDPSLNFKEYKPKSRKKDWFAGTCYEGMKIDKFRCGNTGVAPLRCFGYKDGDIFYPLRLERDHKISDNG